MIPEEFAHVAVDRINHVINKRASRNDPCILVPNPVRGNPHLDLMQRVLDNIHAVYGNPQIIDVSRDPSPKLNKSGVMLDISHDYVPFVVDNLDEASSSLAEAAVNTMRQHVITTGRPAIALTRDETFVHPPLAVSPGRAVFIVVEPPLMRGGTA